MGNPLDFIVNAFSIYVVSKNLEVIIIGVITVMFLYVIFKTIQNGFPRQGKDPERNKIVRFTIHGLFITFFLTFFYLAFYEQVHAGIATSVVSEIDSDSIPGRQLSISPVRSRMQSKTGIHQTNGRDHIIDFWKEKSGISFRCGFYS